MSIFVAAFGTGAAVPPGVLGRGAETGARGDAKKVKFFLRKEIKGLSLQSFSATAQAGERASSLKDWKTRKVQASTDFNTIKI